MRLLYTIVLALFVTPFFAQSLSPSVIASAGSSFTSAQFSMDYTLGETFVTTLSNGSNILTQGFHQPQAGVIVEGCLDPEACNFNIEATNEDGSCYFPGDSCDDGDLLTQNDTVNADCACEGVLVEDVFGCTAIEACNYNPNATIDDGTCELPGFPCDDANASTVDDVLSADCICEGLLSGCSAAAACNYNPDAIIDDGSCVFPGDPCDDGEIATTNDSYAADCACEGEPIEVIEGCTDAEACNYDPAATIDDASCVLIGDGCDDNDAGTSNDVVNADCVCQGEEVVIIEGCTDGGACNYDPTATVDDGTCYAPGDICTDGNSFTLNDEYNADCVCVGDYAGCTSELACNYDAGASIEDGSCFFPGDSCNDGDLFTENDVYTADCVCEGQPILFSGCTDPLACNFDPSAIIDNGSCFAPGDACNDGNIFTVDDIYTADCECQGTDVGPILGCTASEACNYNAAANIDDASCVFPGEPCDDGLSGTLEDALNADCVCEGQLAGCTEPAANNYNPQALIDDGSCEFDVLGCTDPDALNFNPNANVDNGTCTYGVPGCTATEACNYNASANVDDASCVFPGEPCDDGNDGTVQDELTTDCTCIGLVAGCTIEVASNYNPNAVIDDGSCEFDNAGCTDPEALNFDPAALFDDGSCIYPILGCIDADACNYNADANVDDASCVFPGCGDDVACNYDPAVGCNDFSLCDYPTEFYLDCAGNCLNDTNDNFICDELEAQGCTDENALNYDALAVIDDGSCEFPTPGCTIPGSCNFNPNANIEDGSCTTPGCNDPEACNFDPEAGCYDGNCDYAVNYYDCNGICLQDENSNGICDQYEIFGCTEQDAINFNVNATSDDGSCIFGGCLDVEACNYDANADEEDGSCIYPGCNDVNACNFDSEAGCLETGSCVYAATAYDCNGVCLNDANENGICDEFDSLGCTDELADNYNPNATIDDGTCVYIGCLDPTACNFDPTALEDDGSCAYPGCSDATACNYDATAGCDDGSCIPSGCTNAEACNYNSAAGCDDSSCTFPGCNDNAACNFDPLAGCLLAGSCTYPEFAYDCFGECLADGNNNGICDPFDNQGCTDPIADNYNPFALEEDGSCIYIGCLDVNACNFDPTALEDDGSCVYPSETCLNCAGECILDADADDVCDCLEIEGCTNPESVNYNPEATEFDGSCILGCDDPFAINYDPQANEDDGTCIYQILGCTYPTACNFNPEATTDNNTCSFPGCNDLAACNYDPAAGCLLEGSCEYLDENNNGQCDLYEIYGCTNGDACNFNPLATFDDGTCAFDSETTTEVNTGNSYDWEGTTYTESGVYTVTYTSAQGCDSVLILNLTITFISELNLDQVQLWPNPANAEVQVLLNGQSAERLEVYDVVGKHIESVQRTSKLDVSRWSSGIYVVRIFTSNAVIERRLEVVR